ncbi:hypothetical protein HDU93_009201, partial [Gonapodya sp. JEL0774]
MFDASPLTTLPDEVLISILLFARPFDVFNSVSAASRRLLALVTGAFTTKGPHRRRPFLLADVFVIPMFSRAPVLRMGVRWLERFEPVRDAIGRTRFAAVTADVPVEREDLLHLNVGEFEKRFKLKSFSVVGIRELWTVSVPLDDGCCRAVSSLLFAGSPSLASPSLWRTGHENFASVLRCAQEGRMTLEVGSRLSTLSLLVNGEALEQNPDYTKMVSDTTWPLHLPALKTFFLTLDDAHSDTSRMDTFLSALSKWLSTTGATISKFDVRADAEMTFEEIGQLVLAGRAS